MQPWRAEMGPAGAAGVSWCVKYVVALISGGFVPVLAPAAPYPGGLDGTERHPIAVLWIGPRSRLAPDQPHADAALLERALDKAIVSGDTVMRELMERESRCPANGTTCAASSAATPNPHPRTKRCTVPSAVACPSSRITAPGACASRSCNAGYGNRDDRSRAAVAAPGDTVASRSI